MTPGAAVTPASSKYDIAVNEAGPLNWIVVPGPQP